MIYSTTMLPATNDAGEISRCFLDLLKKLNDVSSSIPTISTNGPSIYASGSNSNGYYVQFADGTMICRQNTATITIIGGPYDGWYEQTLDWTFPVPFVGSPQVPAPGFMRTVAGLAAFTWIGLISSSGTRFVANSLDNTTQGYFLATATGRWK